ncbi:hypothetical protein NQ318_014431, partial [Aromia moschata]
MVNDYPSLDSGQRIAVLQQKLSELRKTYADVKAELAAVERRRKKIRRREREGHCHCFKWKSIFFIVDYFKKQKMLRFDAVLTMTWIRTLIMTCSHMKIHIKVIVEVIVLECHIKVTDTGQLKQGVMSPATEGNGSDPGQLRQVFEVFSVNGFPFKTMTVPLIILKVRVKVI